MALRGVKWITISMLACVNLVSAFEKCSEAPKDVCGKNAKCLDDYTYTVYGESIKESVCKCDEGYFGPPPKCSRCKFDDSCKENEFCAEDHECKVGCRIGSCKNHQYCDIQKRTCNDGCLDSYDCEDDEFCIEKNKKCVKICENYSCPANSACTAKFHTKLCSCVDGNFPVEGAGCRPKTPEDEKNINCDSKCGSNSECSLDSNKIYCYCPYFKEESYAKPSISFLTDDHKADMIPDYNPFDSCPKQVEYLPPTKPGDEDFISLASVAILSG